MIIGIDNGNANTKTVSNCFLSGVKTHEVKPPMSDEILEWNNLYYTLVNQRNSYLKDKTENLDCFVLSLFAIAKEIESRCMYTTNFLDIDLAIGLPPEHYSLLKEKFQNYFLSFGSTVSFIYNEKKYNIIINSVRVFPQAFSAIATKVSKLKEYSQTYIVDIGGYTVDTLLLSNGKPDLTYCHSLELGIITMYKKIIHKVNLNFGLTIKDSHVYDVLTNKPTVLEDDVIELIKTETLNHTNEILNTLREEGIDLKTNPVLFVGGGSQLLKNYLVNSDKVKLSEFIPEIYANALGYEKLAQAQIIKQKNKK